MRGRKSKWKISWHVSQACQRLRGRSERLTLLVHGVRDHTEVLDLDLVIDSADKEASHSSRRSAQTSGYASF